VQHFEVIEDYQAEKWSRPRRIVAKLEINCHGVNRRFVVTNLSGQGQGIYHGVYVQRGAVPEKPIGEMKNGLQMDRLSFHRFRANGLKLLEHTLAYALVVLHREATATIPEIAKAEVSTLRQKVWKVGAVVKTSVRRIWFHFSETWPYREEEDFLTGARGNTLCPPSVAKISWTASASWSKSACAATPKPTRAISAAPFPTAIWGSQKGRILPRRVA
jgi:hypothetical protein